MKSKIKLGILLATLSVIFLVPAVASAVIDTIITKALKKIHSDAVDLHILQHRAQVLVLSRDVLVIFESATGKELARYKFGVGDFPMRLDVGDFSGDGQLEAAVTSVSYKQISSYLFSLKDSGSLEKISDEQPYFFRLVEKGDEKFLVGQKSSSIEPFAGKVYRLKWDGKRFIRGEKLDLPKKANIYQFSPVDNYNWETFWVRNDQGQLRRYEKIGKKWKIVYKTSDKFRGGVNCFIFKRELIMSERIKVPLCVPTPMSIVLRTQDPNQESGALIEERIIVDSHKFLLAGIILEPSIPQKGFIDILSYTGTGGVVSCKKYGPYQGWIADYYVERVKKDDKELIKVFVLRDSSEKYGRIRFSELDITNVDCSEEM